ncbi:MAG: CocE/NonD family hydrolase [Pseudomonadota bacterium]|nr:CocE/NonD family hydrolase [Pseudomonadota bacterium]
MNPWNLFLIICVATLMQSCAHMSKIDYINQTKVNKKYYHVVITDDDGHQIAFTVYQPKLSQHQQAPLLLHTHGFGLSRMDSPNLSLYGLILPTGRIAKEAWNKGYWVISYDQRGHGDSAGKIRLTDPEKEAQDVITLINWAEKNLPQLSRNENGARVGMIGESYGGGVQYIASSLDARLQAIVPITTWYDLTSSLAPNGTPKSNWIGFLNIIGDWWNWNKFDPALKQAYQDTQKGQIHQSTYEFLKKHHAYWFCENAQPPQANAMIIQGFRDVLFPFNEAINAAKCLKTSGQKVSLIGVDGGHLQPFTQHSPFFETPIWYIGKDITCSDNKKYDLKASIINWLDNQLKDIPQTAADKLPEVCINGSPADSLSDLDASRRHTIKSTLIDINSGEYFFLPFERALSDIHITGTPLFNITIKIDSDIDPTIFMSLAYQSSNQHFILNEQVHPLNMSRKKQHESNIRSVGLTPHEPLSQFNEMPSINHTLKSGEVLGLLT